MAEAEPPGGIPKPKFAVAPFPLNETTCGLPLALSDTLTLPIRVPVAVGVNVMDNEQVADALIETGQLSDSAKSPLLEMLVTERGALPLLVRVTVCGVLVVPTL